MAPEDDGEKQEEIIQTNGLPCRKTCQLFGPAVGWYSRTRGPSNKNGFISPGAEAANQADARGVAGGLVPARWHGLGNGQGESP
jgi:hypothetical protein